MSPDEAPAPTEDERKQERAIVALLALVAIVQLGGWFARGTHDLIVPSLALPHLMVVLPAAGFAIGVWRGLRLRAGIVAFALLWSALSIWAAVALTRFAAEMAPEPGLVAPPVARGLVPLVAARSVCFVAATIALVAGRPGRTRRTLGLALGVSFGVLFVAEHAYLRLR